MRYNNNATGCVAVGLEALRGTSDANPLSGDYNTGVGQGAGEDIRDGSSNTLIGYHAGRAITSGATNTAVGANAMDVVTTGNSNVAVGQDAGALLTTGSQNVLIGMDAADTITTASQVIAIGCNVDPGNVDMSITIGHDISGKGANTAFIAGTSGAYNGANSSSWSTTSDRRIKKNIVNNDSGLDKLKQIQVCNFEYKTEDEIKTDNPELTDVVRSAAVDQQGLQLGVIAQEIEGVLPEVVKTQSTGVKTVNPDNLTWYLVNAIKELSTKNDELAAEIATLKSLINN